MIDEAPATTGNPHLDTFVRELLARSGAAICRVTKCNEQEAAGLLHLFLSAEIARVVPEGTDYLAACAAWTDQNARPGIDDASLEELEAERQRRFEAWVAAAEKTEGPAEPDQDREES